MIIPSIDLQGGQAVQLIGGKELAIEAGDPRPIARRFSLVGELAVIDLDAALGQGQNSELVRQLVRRHPCRVGGGIRDAASALAWLDAGARCVILGTAAQPEVLRQLPSARVMAALDSVDGEVVVQGWRQRTGRGVVERMAELRGLVSGFLVTFVEREGRLGGIDMERVAQVVDAAGDLPVTVAGGVTTAQEVAAIDRLGADCQVGMALYTGKLELADALGAMLRSDRPDLLWPTVVVDEGGVALGLAYSDAESLGAALEQGRGVYHSRSRGLWVKGQSSGATQRLLRVDLDCDRDTLRFTVQQAGAGFCHAGTRTCFGPDRGLGRLARRVAARVATSPEGSYTRRLLDDPEFLRAKLLEEAGELACAQTADEVAGEAGDLLYLALVALARGGVSLAAAERVLDARALRVSRRPGHAKPPPELEPK